MVMQLWPKQGSHALLGIVAKKAGAMIVIMVVMMVMMMTRSLRRATQFGSQTLQAMRHPAAQVVLVNQPRGQQAGKADACPDEGIPNEYLPAGHRVIFYLIGVISRGSQCQPTA